MTFFSVQKVSSRTVPSPHVVIVTNCVFIHCIPNDSYDNYCFMHLSFKSSKKLREITNSKYDTGFYVYLCGNLFWNSLFLHVGLSYFLVSFHFSLKGSL